MESFESFDEMVKKIQADRDAWPWHKKLRMKIKWKLDNFDSWKREMKSRPARAKHGWADMDTWSLDTYLARVIAETVEHLRKGGVGIPPELVSNGELAWEDWDKTLQEIVEGFSEYANSENFGNHDEEKLNHSFDLLKKWFPALWS